MNRTKAWDLKTALAMVWMIFTIALAVWLFVFNSRLFGEIQNLATPEADAILKHHRMVASEILTMIVALLAGGIGLLYLIWLEKKKALQIHRFFAVFSHELKTSLSRLRLQSESLQDDLAKTTRGGPILRLLDDVGKLEVQLENSLWLARGDEDRFLLEVLPVSQIVGEFAPQFPLLVHLSSEAYLRADRRAIESIFKNIFQNAVAHGEAQNLWIEISPLTPSRLQLKFRDDGRGFQGNSQELGRMFVRHSGTSGTGLGLYLIEKLARFLGGQARFNSLTRGFEVQLDLPGTMERPSAEAR